MIIDAHQHIWNLNRQYYPWLGASHEPINRTLGMEDVRAELHAAGVAATILVQSADADADTDNMLETAGRSPEVVAVVAWVPLDNAAVAATRLEELRLDPHVVGVRALIHDMPDPEWILRPDVGAGLALLEQAGLTLDFVTSDPAGLALLPALSSRHPDLRIVIDHLGKPPVGATPGMMTEWRLLLAVAAESPLVYAKISGLYSSIGAQEGWNTDQLRPIIFDAIDIFGSSRLMYGGDWPMSVLAGGYTRVWQALSSVFDELPPVDQEHLFSITAKEFYNLDPELLANVPPA